MFLPPINFAAGGGLVAADFDGDGRIDLAQVTVGLFGAGPS